MVETTKTIQQIEPPAYIQQHAQQLLANIGGTTDPETGQLTGGFLYDPVAPHVDQNGNPIPRIADFSQDQIQAQELARQGIGGYQPYINQATGATTAGIDAFNPQAVSNIQGQIDQGTGYNIGQQYLNPYQQNVIDATMSEMNRQQAMNMNDIAAQAAAAKSFGGSRHGILEAETMRGFDANRTNALAGLNAANFAQAQQAQEAHRQRQLQGAQTSGAVRNMAANANFAGAQTAAGIGGLQQQYGLTDVSTLGATGDQQQRQRQLGLDVAHDEYLREQNRPFQMASFYSDILGGVPSGQSSYLQKEIPERNKLADALGGLGTLATAGNQFGWWGDKTD